MHAFSPRITSARSPAGRGCAPPRSLAHRHHPRVPRRAFTCTVFMALLRASPRHLSTTAPRRVACRFRLLAFCGCRGVAVPRHRMPSACDRTYLLSLPRSGRMNERFTCVRKACRDSRVRRRRAALRAAARTHQPHGLLAPHCTCRTAPPPHLSPLTHYLCPHTLSAVAASGFTRLRASTPRFSLAHCCIALRATACADAQTDGKICATRDAAIGNIITVSRLAPPGAR